MATNAITPFSQTTGPITEKAAHPELPESFKEIGRIMDFPRLWPRGDDALDPDATSLHQVVRIRSSALSAALDKQGRRDSTQ
jgi:hypothetical protein